MDINFLKDIVGLAVFTLCFVVLAYIIYCQYQSEKRSAAFYKNMAESMILTDLEVRDLVAKVQKECNYNKIQNEQQH